jgi:nitroimidazol reductase NimA-like FMN-containing flavoprotein (pyridoxamine 5'-phosphate oxidase superfamily)
MTDRRELAPLTVEECYELMRDESIGRVAVQPTYGPPVVTPVTFAVDGVCILFRSDPGEKVDSVGRRVSFQVDRFDTVHRTGWSVLVQGTLLFADPEDAHRVRVAPWFGAGTFPLRIIPDVVTGRRLQLHLPETDSRGYR